MYFPNYVAGIVYMTGVLIAVILYIIRIRKVGKELGISFWEMYDEEYSQKIKEGLKGLGWQQWGVIFLFLFLAIMTAIINKQ